MSSNAAPIDSSNQTSATSETSSTTPTTPSTGGEGGGVGSFSSMSDFKTTAPEVYKAMMQSIATNICNDSKNWTDRIIETMKEGEDNTP